MASAKNSWPANELFYFSTAGGAVRDDARISSARPMSLLWRFEFYVLSEMEYTSVYVYSMFQETHTHTLVDGRCVVGI
jgi:hypothetical protein